MDGCVRGRIYDLVQHLGLQRLQNFKDFGVYLFFSVDGNLLGVAGNSLVIEMRKIVYFLALYTITTFD